MSAVCRRAGVEDAEQIVALYGELYGILSGFGLPFSLERDELMSMLSVMLRSKLCYIAVAEPAGGGVRGFITAGIIRMDKKLSHPGGALVGRLHDIHVAPELRGRGVAAQLLSGFEGWLRENGAALAETHILTDNEPSMKFFEKHGYRTLGKIVYKELMTID